MPEDPVLTTLQACRGTLLKMCTLGQRALENEAWLRIQAIDRAVLEHKRSSDLHRLIAVTIRQEMETEFNVRRQQATTDEIDNMPKERELA